MSDPPTKCFFVDYTRTMSVITDQDFNDGWDVAKIPLDVYSRASSDDDTVMIGAFYGVE